MASGRGFSWLQFLYLMFINILHQKKNKSRLDLIITVSFMFSKGYCGCQDDDIWRIHVLLISRRFRSAGKNFATERNSQWLNVIKLMQNAGCV